MFKIRKQANLHIKKNNQLFLLDKSLYRLSFVSKLRRYTLSPAYSVFCNNYYKHRPKLLQTVFPDYINKTLNNLSNPLNSILGSSSKPASFLFLLLIFKNFFKETVTWFARLALNVNFFISKLLFIFHNVAATNVEKLLFNFLNGQLLNSRYLAKKFKFNLITPKVNFYSFLKNAVYSNKRTLVLTFALGAQNLWVDSLDVFFKTYQDYIAKFNLQAKYNPMFVVTESKLSSKKDSVILDLLK